jgi:hypothetical protein
MAGLHRLWEAETVEHSQAVYQEIRYSSPLYMREMTPRAIPRSRGSRRYKMDRSDPSTWYAHGGVILLVLAVIPGHLKPAPHLDGGMELAALGRSRFRS